MRARLVPLEDGPPIDLVKDLTLVGRTEGCDVRLDHKSVSKLHCVLVKTDGLVLVRDLGSTNGTRVNGQRIRRAALLPNDQLFIATFKYRVKFGEEPAPAPGPVPSPKAVGGLADDGSDDLPAAGDANPDRGGPPSRRNAHPDVYPDGSAPRGAG